MSEKNLDDSTAKKSVAVDLAAMRHLAELSNIQMSDTELENMKDDVASILQYIEQLGELDTRGVEPTFQVSGRKNVWREDKVEKQITREKLLELADETTENQVKVPKVL